MFDASACDVPADADAVLYVCGPAPRPEDVTAVAALCEDRAGGASTRPGAWPRGVLGVLARADLVGWMPGRSQPVSAAAARPHADSAERVLTIGVVPVSAMLARAARRITVEDFDALRRIASVRSTDDRGQPDGVWWYSADLFRTHAVWVERSQREQLLSLLDLSGVRLAVDALRANPGMTLDEMGELMRKASGIAALDTWVRGALWDAAAARAGSARMALERRMVTELASGRSRAAASLRLLRRSALISVPWAVDQLVSGPLTLENVLAWAAVARREAASARTSHGAHAALARYRHFLAVAEDLMLEGRAA